MKRFVSRLMAVIMALMIALPLSACGENPVQQAEGVVTGFFEAIKVMDMKTASKYMDMGRITEIDDFATLPDGGTKILTAIFGKLQYEIVSLEQVSDTKVCVTVKISSVDMVPIFKQYLSKAMEYLFIHVADNPTLSGEEVMSEMADLFVTLLEPDDVAMVTNEVEIMVIKTESGWKIDATDTFVSALLGGFEQAAAQLEASLG